MNRDEPRDRGGTLRLELVIGMVLRAGVALSSACLAVGLAWTLVSGESGAARLLLQIGLIVLLATPVARVVVSIVEYVGERDWRFATLTAIVLLELLASAVAALVFNRKL
jgi:uncharacterized membrane protein